MTFQDLLDSFNVNDDICNKSAYDALLKQCMNDRITPVIGAGLSLWTGYPLWQNLLSKKANGTPDTIKSEVALLLDEFKYEQAASKLQSFYAQNAFLRSLVEEYSPDKIDEKIRPAFHHFLPELFHGPIITTNYDVSLEKLFGAPSVITPEDTFQLPELDSAIQNNKRILVKLHGTITAPNTLVLTNERYNETYGPDPEAPDLKLPLPNVLSRIFHSAPPFFLGCGLGPDRTCAVLKECVGTSGFALLELPKETENKNDPYHPILMDTDGFLPALQKRRSHLDSMNLRVIWYPYGCHDAVEVLINQLIDDCKNADNDAENATKLAREMKDTMEQAIKLSREMAHILSKQAHELATQSQEVTKKLYELQYRSRLIFIINRILSAKSALSDSNRVLANDDIWSIHNEIVLLFSDEMFISNIDVFDHEETQQIYDGLHRLDTKANAFLEDCKRNYSGVALESMEKSVKNYHKWISEALNCIDDARKRALKG